MGIFRVHLSYEMNERRPSGESRELLWSRNSYDAERSHSWCISTSQLLTRYVGIALCQSFPKGRVVWWEHGRSSVQTSAGRLRVQLIELRFLRSVDITLFIERTAETLRLFHIESWHSPLRRGSKQQIVPDINPIFPFLFFPFLSRPEAQDCSGGLTKACWREYFTSSINTTPALAILFMNMFAHCMHSALPQFFCGKEPHTTIQFQRSLIKTIPPR